MLFRVLSVVLLFALAAESAFILSRRQPANRFKPIDAYDGLVAFDTATGQLCKTLRTKSAAQIEQEERAAKAAKETEPCPPPRAHSTDPILDAIESAGTSKRCGGDGEDIAENSGSGSNMEFVAGLPTCASIH